MNEQILLKLAEELNLPRSDEIKDYLAHREWGVALEMVCSLIADHDLQITAQAFSQLQNAGLSMGLAAEEFDYLKQYIKA